MNHNNWNLQSQERGFWTPLALADIADQDCHPIVVFCFDFCIHAPSLPFMEVIKNMCDVHQMFSLPFQRTLQKRICDWRHAKLVFHFWLLMLKPKKTKEKENPGGSSLFDYKCSTSHSLNVLLTSTFWFRGSSINKKRLHYIYEIIKKSY